MKPLSLNLGQLRDNIPAVLPEEQIDILAQGAGVRIERILSRGHASPETFWYEQTQDEFVLLLSGAAELHFEADDSRVRMSPGQYLTIPAGVRHRVAWTSAEETTLWLAVFF